MGASSDAGDVAENAQLDVRAPKAITASTLKITTKDLVTGGLTIVASGYTPGETARLAPSTTASRSPARPRSPTAAAR